MSRLVFLTPDFCFYFREKSLSDECLALHVSIFIFLHFSKNLLSYLTKSLSEREWHKIVLVNPKLRGVFSGIIFV